MAVINGTTNSSYYIVYLNAYEKDYSVQNNTSTVVVELHMKRTSGSYLYNGGSYNGTITVDGVKKSYSGTLPYPTAFYEGTDKTYAILTFYNIHHDDNGSKTVRISATYSADFSPTSGTVTNGSLKLTDIPRATNCPSITGYIKSSYNIPLSPASSSFTHSMYITFGNIKKWLQSDGTLGDSEYKFSTRNPMLTLSKDFYSEFDGYSASGTIKLNTYNGSKLIGSKPGTLIAQCNPAICSPSIESATVVDTNANTIALTNNQNDIVKFASEVLITPTIRIGDPDDDRVRITTKSINNNVFTENSVVVTNPTDKSFTIALTNSRQLTSNSVVSASGDLINYVPLTFNIAKIYRPEPTTGEVKIQYNGNYFDDKFYEGTGTIDMLEVGLSMTSDNLVINLPDGIYGSITNEVVIFKTNKYKMIAIVEPGMMYHGYIRLVSLEDETIIYDIYAASTSAATGEIEVSINNTSIPTDEILDLGTIDYINTNYPFLTYFSYPHEGGTTITNELSISWSYKEKGSENWIEGGALSPVIDKDKNIYENEESLGTIFDYTKQYDFIFYCSDKIANLNVENTVQRGFPIFWWNEDSVHILGDLYVRDRSILGGNAIYDYTLTENASSIEINDLDMLADGGEYEITIYHSGTTQKDTRITFNGITNGYYQTGFSFGGSSNSISSDDYSSTLTAESAYRPNKSNIYWGLLCSTSKIYPATITGKFFKQVDNRIAWSFKNECSVSGKQWITFTTGVNDQEVTNLTSLQFYRDDGEFYAGTRIIIKRVI